ncbi:hypothetical protein E0Z10_g1278 [Xylaria hypoxylon]|uniref:DUF427 domain-containing protein n=1 Tax=Xylaria hypoxylon TaxID=37992 RepID=A0A4Z0Z7C7_9PEZI|nr:hypothetical protein E0Z10_g1278 [Xylaria hypoxylon]
MPPSPRNLDELASALLANGPVKTLPAAPKRIRVRLGGRYVADTTRAVYVWEHAYYPGYYLPLDAFAEGVLSYPGSGGGNGNGDRESGYALATLSAGGVSTDRVIVFTRRGESGSEREDGNVLAGLVRVEFAAVEAWFEEDARIDVHPKDPFKRVDVVFSARPVRVSISGTEVARSEACFHLYETGLPVRFYLPVTAVRADLLRDSAAVTACPYKGEASYYDVVVGGVDGLGEIRLRDVVWYYKNPKIECAAIAGCLCFYNEKVDIELDGKMLERPKALFS